MKFQTDLPCYRPPLPRWQPDLQRDWSDHTPEVKAWFNQHVLSKERLLPKGDSLQYQPRFDLDGDVKMTDMIDPGIIEKMTGALRKGRVKSNMPREANDADKVQQAWPANLQRVFLIDTNFWLAHLSLIEDLLRQFEASRANIVIPWVVLQELDGLKNATKTYSGSTQHISVSQQAQRAIKFIHEHLGNTSGLYGQRPDEIVDATQVGDDGILDSARFIKERRGVPVTLLSNDINLGNKFKVLALGSMAWEQGLTAVDVLRRVLGGTWAQTPSAMLQNKRPMTLDLDSSDDDDDDEHMGGIEAPQVTPAVSLQASTQQQPYTGPSETPATFAPPTSSYSNRFQAPVQQPPLRQPQHAPGTGFGNGFGARFTPSTSHQALQQQAATGYMPSNGHGMMDRSVPPVSARHASPQPMQITPAETTTAASTPARSLRQKKPDPFAALISKAATDPSLFGNDASEGRRSVRRVSVHRPSLPRLQRPRDTPVPALDMPVPPENQPLYGLMKEICETILKACPDLARRQLTKELGQEGSDYLWPPEAAQLKDLDTLLGLVLRCWPNFENLFQGYRLNARTAAELHLGPNLLEAWYHAMDYCVSNGYAQLTPQQLSECVDAWADFWRKLGTGVEAPEEANAREATSESWTVQKDDVIQQLLA